MHLAKPDAGGKGGKRNKCEHCGKAFSSERYCKVHEKVHTDLGFPCEKRGKKFAAEWYCEKHTKQCGENPIVKEARAKAFEMEVQNPFACQFRGKSFPIKSLLLNMKCAIRMISSTRLYNTRTRPHRRKAIQMPIL